MSSGVRNLRTLHSEPWRSTEYRKTVKTIVTRSIQEENSL